MQGMGMAHGTHRKERVSEKLNMISSHEPVCTNAATMQLAILSCKIIKIYNDHHVCRRSR
jgi:hypothetical protein